MNTGASISPHGGTLISRVLRGVIREAALERARDLPGIQLSPASVSDLELIAVGAFSPLAGFMGQADYQSVVETMHLANGLVWSLPITLPAEKGTTDHIGEGDEIVLYEEDRLLGLMTVEEKFGYDKVREAHEVFRTTEEAHPGVARLYAQGDVLLGGPVTLLNRPKDRSFIEFRHDPAQARRMFAERGWRRIVGFQTRNPIHRAHEYIQKSALEIVDGLFLHPLVGETGPDDVPADVRIRSYQAILRDYYPPERVILGVFPATMRYAGPREAIFHAICRKNYGCTHFIVGRDHAGVGSYYGLYEAQALAQRLQGDLGITILNYAGPFYCEACDGMATDRTCPHLSAAPHLTHQVSGTLIRRILAEGAIPDLRYIRPAVVESLYGLPLFIEEGQI